MNKKSSIFSKNNIKNAFLIAFLVIIFLFFYVNEFSLQYWINNFSKLNDFYAQFYVLDVGQANANLFVAENFSMLIDTGSEESSEKLLASLNKVLKTNTIDYLILTHSDEDHVGGAPDVLRQFQIKNVLRPKLLACFEFFDLDYNYVLTSSYEKAMQAVYSEPNCTINFLNDTQFNVGENVAIQILTCQKDDYVDTNSYCPFIHIKCFSKSIMITSDATATREKELLTVAEKKKLDLQSDYLVVSHHGAKSSTSESFLSLVRPKVAFVSAGDKKYPSVEVKQRLIESGVEKILTTREIGMIGVGLKDDKEIVLTMSRFIDLPILFVCLALVLMSFMTLNRKNNRALRFKFSNNNDFSII